MTVFYVQLNVYDWRGDHITGFQLHHSKRCVVTSLTCTNAIFKLCSTVKADPVYSGNARGGLNCTHVQCQCYQLPLKHSF